MKMGNKQIYIYIKNNVTKLIILNNFIVKEGDESDYIVENLNEQFYSFLEKINIFDDIKDFKKTILKEDIN